MRYILTIILPLLAGMIAGIGIGQIQFYNNKPLGIGMIAVSLSIFILSYIVLNGVL